VEFRPCRLKCTVFHGSQWAVLLSRWGQGISGKFKTKSRRLLRLIASIFLLAALPCQAVTLKQLREESNLTPERLISYFRDFKFQLGERVQPPEIFLAAQSGDCDDFASLAADILREKKYTTRLIAVFMDGQTHVICYIEEIKGYLDYNHRQDRNGVQATTGDLEDMADQVAAYFRSPWRCVGEITYQAGERRIGRIVFR